MSASFFLKDGKGTAALLFSMIVFGFVGCGPGRGPGAVDLKLDKAVAKSSLTKALDAWKAGGKPADLSSQQPSIVVSDVNWDSGAKLVEYKLGTERESTAVLHVQVELSLDKDGQSSTQQVEYTVGTDPTISVSSVGSD